MNVCSMKNDAHITKLNNMKGWGKESEKLLNKMLMNSESTKSLEDGTKYPNLWLLNVVIIMCAFDLNHVIVLTNVFSWL